MPIPPPPFSMKCPQCHWSKTIVLTSDVIFSGTIPSRCPDCSYAPLTQSKASPMAVLLAKLAKLSKR